jgi:hypothetical protein
VTWALPEQFTESGNSPKKVEDNGNVVRSEIPCDIDISLEESQIETTRVDVTDFTDIAGADDLPDLLNRGGIEEGMTDHEHKASTLRELDQLLALRRGRSHRLLNESVLAGQQAFLGQSKVVLHGRGNRNGVQSGYPEKLPEIGEGRDRGIECAEMP